MSKAKQPTSLQASLAGWNVSPRADRSSAREFLRSYLKAFPERWEWLKPQMVQAVKIANKLLVGTPKIITKTPKTNWIPPSHYIPDSPNPRRSYRRQAANIARDMREKLEKLGELTLE
jgi:hypothetical protein